MRVEAQRRELERQEKKNLGHKNGSLRAKTQSLKLTYDDLKPKIGKLQAVAQRVQQTSEAIVRRWEGVKHLRGVSYKKQQLLSHLADIVNHVLQENQKKLLHVQMESGQGVEASYLG